MRNRLPLIIFTLAVVLSAGPVAAAEHHLYVAPILLIRFSVGRASSDFGCSMGMPQPNPDLIYPSASGPIALALDGSLYAQDDEYLDHIDRFAPGSNRPESSLIVAPCRRGYPYGGLSGMAFDAAGNAYMAFSEGASGLEPFNPRGCGAQTIAIYPPGAKRHKPRAARILATRRRQRGWATAGNQRLRQPRGHRHGRECRSRLRRPDDATRVRPGSFMASAGPGSRKGWPSTGRPTLCMSA